MKSKIYYVRTGMGVPIVTVSIGKSGRIYARGIAICSTRDSVRKATGRDIAEGRMVKAFTNKESTEVSTPTRIRRSISTMLFFGKELLHKEEEEEWKLPGHIKVSEYNAKPTKRERRMLQSKPAAPKRRTVSKDKKPAKK